MCKPGDEFVSFLMQAGCDEGVIAHCLAVRDVAVLLASEMRDAGVRVDCDLVTAGAVLHDIGRSKTHGMDHADAGGSICHSLGFEDTICHIVENHIGAGLFASEREAFGLPAVDRIPQTLEEKIVAHADNMVKGTRVLSKDEYIASLDRFPESLQARFLGLAEEIESLCKRKEKITG